MVSESQQHTPIQNVQNTPSFTCKDLKKGERGLLELEWGRGIGGVLYSKSQIGTKKT